MNDQRSPERPTWDFDEITAPADEPQIPVITNRSRRRAAGAALIGGLLVGGAAGAALFGPLTTSAASPTATPNAPTTQGTNGGGQGTDQDQGMGHAGFGGHNEAVSDASVVAKAIGLSEADLTTALQGGQTVAQVAKAHSVDVQKVIDALVADGQAELDAAVKAGTITQAQADAKKAEVSQRATDQVNGTLMGGPGGHGGPGDHDATPSATPTP